MSRLVAQKEHPRPNAMGVYVGVTVHEHEGTYTAVVHNRIYDGIKVESQWSSDPVVLDATDDQSARKAAVGPLRQMLEIVGIPEGAVA